MNARGSHPSVLLTLAAFTVLLAAPMPVGADTAVIPIGYAAEDDILPAARMLLSPSGKLSFDRRTHSLVVVDHPEAIADIRDLVQRLDRPTPEVVIRVRFDSNEQKKRRTIDAKGRVSGSGVSVGNRRQDGIDVTVQSERSHQSEQAEQRIRVTSGSAAFIATGKTAVQTGPWRKWCRRYPICQDAQYETHMHTGFFATPRVRGRQVVLRLSPRVTDTPSSGRRTVQATRIDTEILIPMGKWVDIGGTLRQHNDISAAILESHSNQQSRTLRMMIRIDPAP